MAKLNIVLSASMDKLRKGLKNATKSVEDWKTKVAKIGKVALGVGAGALAAGLAAATKRSAELAAKFQQTTVAFNTMVGDSQKAAALIEALTEFSTKTPFTPEQVQKAAKTLLAFGFAADDVKGTLKILGDVSAGTGKDLSELAVIFGQIKSAGRLMGQDLLQLINAGFNPLQVMSEKTGKSMAQLKDEMSKGLITFEDVQQAFIDATSAGGTFNNMMEEMSGNVGGLFSTLKGNWDELLKSIGRGTTGPISSLINKLNELVKVLQEVEQASRIAAGGTFETPYELARRSTGNMIASILEALPGESIIAAKLRESMQEDLDRAMARQQLELEPASKQQRLDTKRLIDEARNQTERAVEEFRLDGSEKQVSRPEFTTTTAATTAMDLEGMLANNRERARQLEESIAGAFRPQGEIASNLARIGGERGIAVARNIPEKQLTELQNIRKGVEAMEQQLDKLDGVARWPGG